MHEARLKRLEDQRSWIGPVQFPVLGDGQLGMESTEERT